MSETAVKTDQIRIPDFSGLGYKVADPAQADFGRKEITIAEREMPGLMSVRKNTRPSSR
jgi:adenosylhomocysteinase